MLLCLNTSLSQHKASGYDALVALVQQMWDQEPDERPAFDVIVHELSKIFIWQKQDPTGICTWYRINDTVEVTGL